MMRRSGILLPVFSLPSRHGIGKMGKAAYEFVDFLKGAEVSCWQVLPLSPTGYGDSPYQSCCTYAGNPYLIDFDLLAEEGLLVPADYDGLNWGEDSSTIPYALLYTQCYEVLRIAFSNAKPDPDFDAFVEAQKDWLEDYALYMALKFAHGGKPFTEWGRSLRRRKKEALDQARETYKEDIAFHKFIQYQFFKQWYQLKAYANEQGISIIGDIPIFTSPDSADVWANKSMFCLDTKGHPLEVAGVPPDYFAAEGQLWGNPLYDWKAHKKDSYRWWIERVRHQLDQVDYVRIDHFRGFEAYWAVPAGEKTAMNGKWKKGPGEELFRAIEKALGEELPIFAEDLGIITPEVEKLRDSLGYPGMKVLQFGFDGLGESSFLPHQLDTRNCICYTGTHDNDTTLGWYQHTAHQNQDKVRRYMNTDASSISWDFIRICLGTIARYAIFPVQDLLNQGSEHRMNTPGTAAGNWEYRFRAGLLNEGMAKGLRQMTELFGRFG